MTTRVDVFEGNELTRSRRARCRTSGMFYKGIIATLDAFC
jgi:hypothetical protein